MRIFTWKQRVVTTGVTLFVITLFAGLGWLVGYAIDRPRSGVLLAVLLSYPVSQWALMRSIRRLYQKEAHEDTMNI